MSFKQKPSRHKYLSNVQTLDELHHNNITKFHEEKSGLAQKRKKLDDLYRKQQSFDKSTDIKTRSQTRGEIKQLEMEINGAKNDSKILEYMSKAGEYIVNYYEITCGVYYNINENDTKEKSTNGPDKGITDTVVDITETETRPKKSKEKTGINISDKLKHYNELSQKNRKVKKPVKKRRIVQESSGKKSILQYFNADNPKETEENVNNGNGITIMNRATLQDKYLMIMDKNYACEKVRADKIINCLNCNVEKTLFQSEGSYVCRKCGDTEPVIMESEIPSHKEMANEKQKYPYKKINHLKEKLNQFQSKESADIPENICNAIRMDLRKKKIRPENCAPFHIKSILKKRRLTSYYEHLQQIYCIISGANPITLPREVEETIINMFQAMQESFRAHCPASRSNFLSYSYVLNKLFRILKMPEHAKYFNLLKSKDKRREQDIIWKKICKDMGWTFYPSL